MLEIKPMHRHNIYTHTHRVNLALFGILNIKTTENKRNILCSLAHRVSAHQIATVFSPNPNMIIKCKAAEERKRKYIENPEVILWSKSGWCWWDFIKFNLKDTHSFDSSWLFFFLV